MSQGLESLVVEWVSARCEFYSDLAPTLSAARDLKSQAILQRDFEGANA
jgi:hypothetical protein